MPIKGTINIKQKYTKNITTLKWDIAKELDEFEENKNWKDFNRLLNDLIMCDLTFTKESMSLPEEVKRKMYSIIFPRDENNQQ